MAIVVCKVCDRTVRVVPPLSSFRHVPGYCKKHMYTLKVSVRRKIKRIDTLLEEINISISSIRID